MHTGRVAHIDNLPAGAEVLGPSSAVCPGKMYTGTKGMQPHSAPRSMTEADIAHAVDEYAHSARLAIEAGFDGVKLHGANGYLIEQFLNPIVNQRSEEQFLALASDLSKIGLLYLHLVDHSAMGAPPVPADFKIKLRAGFNSLFILCGGFDRAKAENALLENRGDLVALGRPFLANPDLVARLRTGARLNEPDMATFYTPGPKGYTDYPPLAV